MALERRGNGYYFYEKKRIGKRVVSVYSGGGERGRMMQILDWERQEERAIERETARQCFEAERKKQDDIDELIESFSRDAKAFEEGLFLINGYHVHERQWRRKRNDNKDEGEEA